MTFTADGWALEGRFRSGTGDGGAVITHPHPLYGGDMFNPVVEAMARGFHRAGMATLRFNFRGTGGSQGGYDEGRGEQADVLAALNVLARSGCTRIVLSGYSFGAWVNAHIPADRFAAAGHVMVAPPLAFLDFSRARHVQGPDLVIAGGHDDFAPPALVRSAVNDWNPSAHLSIIDGADHFFWGFLDDISDDIGAFAGRM